MLKILLFDFSTKYYQKILNVKKKIFDQLMNILIIISEFFTFSRTGNNPKNMKV